MDEGLEKNCNDESFDCPQGIDNEERVQLLQRIVDGQATTEEEKVFYSSMEDCDKCRCKNLCDQHLEIKSILKEKLIPVPMPNGLIDQIKGKISGSL